MEVVLGTVNTSVTVAVIGLTEDIENALEQYM